MPGMSKNTPETDIILELIGQDDELYEQLQWRIRRDPTHPDNAVAYWFAHRLDSGNRNGLNWTQTQLVRLSLRRVNWKIVVKSLE